MTIRVLLRDHPHRAIALATDEHILTFRHSASTVGGSTVSLNSTQNAAIQPRCMVEFSLLQETDTSDFRSLSSLSAQGTLGLITIGGDIFLCVVNGSERVATVRPGENVQKITSVEFHCINRSEYDYLVLDRINNFPVDDLEDDGFDKFQTRDPSMEHPCLALKKLLSGGSFYYSADFDLTRRLQDRALESATVAFDSIDTGFLWNSYMIQPLVSFRSRLSDHERAALDSSRILTSAIRGFAMTITVPAASSPVSTSFSGLPSTLTLVSRLSCRRAGTRFNARGIDDDGNVANWVETETVFATPTGMCFSYVQTRGSVPAFWEQQATFTPGQQKIQITRSAEATQPAFDKHMSELEVNYGAVHVVNLLSAEKSGEAELTKRYRQHIRNSPLNQPSEDKPADHELLKLTDYDFHAETRQLGYEAAKGISHYIQDSVEAFAYYLSEEIEEDPKTSTGLRHKSVLRRPMTILQQEGVFRTNCLDCLDRTNLVQTIISQMSLQEFLSQRAERRATSDFWVRHGTLWADNGDALSRIYAGTGALKSSYTRTGKMSIAGALADVRKSAARLYINNFEDKGRQNTIDTLLGRLMGQLPVHLYDPINDWVSAELTKRTSEYSSSDTIHIHVGTFNLNGKTKGIDEDLSSWVCPPVDASQQQPGIVAVGFQEIVELSPQQIMSTDPNRRQAWEDAVKRTLNTNAQSHGSEEYVMLRGGQLVGASLSVFVKASILPYIKNVEGSLKKTGMSGMAGNKGAVAIRMDYANTSICLVTAHLAAGFANYEERNQDYRTISHGLRFQRNRTIEDHDAIIWMGDFNYRIGMSNERTRALVKDKDLETLYANDQLNLQMVHGKTFPFYHEARITFLPTYKYDLGTDDYDSSDKARIPAWCDRVLSKGNNLRQINYETAPLRFSDHRPVWATFQCTVTTMDEKRKDEISEQLYRKRRAVVGDNTATAQNEDSDDEEVLGYESIEPGLPPASSDRRKWWLDNGQPARSKVTGPPGPNYVHNSARPANPFSRTAEPDWVQVDKPTPPPSRAMSMRERSAMRETGGSGEKAPAHTLRKLPPPWHGGASGSAVSSPSNTARSSSNSISLDQQPLQPTKARPSISSDRSPQHREAGSIAAAPIHLKQTLRKPVPPAVAKKPAFLRSESSTRGASGSSSASRPQERYRDDPSDDEHPPPPPRRAATRSENTAKEVKTPSSVAANTVPFPPPPRRSNTVADRGPPLPSRAASVARAEVNTRASSTKHATTAAAAAATATRGPPPSSSLMDDVDDDHGVGGAGKALGGWTALKPS
ncbi:hypothetical protein AAFC00_002647 [Neodothiora populina]|uniref:phosphoinositide 5-phosphatase n=1 Tax=Neodothiora populina TaxID=2781224 RepID=A0ABR3P7R9_9PEZI